MHWRLIDLTQFQNCSVSLSGHMQQLIFVLNSEVHVEDSHIRKWVLLSLNPVQRYEVDVPAALQCLENHVNAVIHMNLALLDGVYAAHALIVW